MTPEEWELKWRELFRQARFANPTASLQDVQKAVLEYMRLHYPRPESPKADPSLSKPGVVSVVKLGLQIKRGASMFKFTPTLIAAALVAGASAFGAAYNIALSDAVVTTAEWVSIVWAVITAVTGVFFQTKPTPPVA